VGQRSLQERTYKVWIPPFHKGHPTLRLCVPVLRLPKGSLPVLCHSLLSFERLLLLKDDHPFTAFNSKFLEINTIKIHIKNTYTLRIAQQHWNALPICPLHMFMLVLIRMPLGILELPNDIRIRDLRFLRPMRWPRTDVMIFKIFSTKKIGEKNGVFDSKQSLIMQKIWS
jgi:hypothetical protein